MSTYTCHTCGEDKEREEMRRYPSGGISTTCKECGPPSKGRRKVRAGREVVPAAPTGIEVTFSRPDPVLNIEQGYGLNARIDDGYLRIEQNDGAGRIDTLMLSRSEACLLFAQFREWAGA